MIHFIIDGPWLVYCTQQQIRTINRRMRNLQTRIGCHYLNYYNDQITKCFLNFSINLSLKSYVLHTVVELDISNLF